VQYLCSNLLKERIQGLYKSAFVGVTKVLIYHDARSEQRKSNMGLVLSLFIFISH
jgi:hypothetical protein